MYYIHPVGARQKKEHGFVETVKTIGSPVEYDLSWSMQKKQKQSAEIKYKHFETF